jgi:Tol biopolymer transport system component
VIDRQLKRGTALGRFVVEEFIGAGGMGEVYAARDVQLGRRVAIKVLPSTRAADPGRVDRFLREARAASSLNHPAIVTIFDSGELDDVHYLAMELIEGETLAQWTRGGRNRDKLVPVLAQVAEGLARAHAGGIVHRDLKPDNIMVARGGYAKIVDFGIAKLTEREAGPGGAAGDTAPSAVLGTTSFMSPEQVEGRSVDHRSDVFAFGCVVYAAFQGRSPFERDSAVKTMNAIVNDPPPPLYGAPPDVERIARRCLAKDPDERYQSMKDVALDLRDVRTPAAAHLRRANTALLLAFIAAVIVGFVSWRLARVGDHRAPASRESAPQMSMIRLTNTGSIDTGAVSPDGKYVVFATREGDDETIFVKQIATGTSMRIVPAVQGFISDVRVSPDGNYVFYTYASRDNANVVDLYQIPMLGGEAKIVAHDVEAGIGVAPEGHRVAFRRFNAVDRERTLVIADIDAGKEDVVLRKRYPEGFGRPDWTPDGKRLTFIFGNEAAGKLRVNMVDFDLATGRMTKIPSPPWPGFGGITWVPDGSGIVLTVAERQQPAQLWYLPVNDGPPKKITSDVAYYGGVTFTSDSKSFVTLRSEDSSNVWVYDVPTGKARALTTGLGSYFGSNGTVWMPDGNILYTAATNQNQREQWRLLDPKTGESREMPNISGWHPAISPDQTKIAYFRAVDGPPRVFVADIDGQNARPLTSTTVSGTQLSWTRDGQSVIYVSSGERQAAWKVNIATGEAVAITDRPVNTPQLSPDGTILLCRYRAAEPGKPLWRTALLPVNGGGKPRFLDIPRGGGPHVYQWLDNHSFAYLDFVNGVGNIWMLDIRGGEPRQITHFDSGRVQTYDVSRDGKSIVLAHTESVNDLVLIRDFR